MGIAPAISVITHIELFSSPNISASDAAKLEQFVKIATVYDTLDAAIVQATIDIRLQKKLKVPDGIIAATALAHGLTLLTRNTADFKQISGLNVINPFNI